MGNLVKLSYLIWGCRYQHYHKQRRVKIEIINLNNHPPTLNKK